ncbi:MAG TPA: glycoside hydrolase family 2 protein, partial [Terriglobales bacterium]
ETKMVSVTPQDAAQLNVRHPRLWWPVQMGEANLYDLHLEFRANGGVSDANDSKFGIRQVTSEMTPEGARLFKINGKNVLIRGAGWTPDMMLRTSPERQEQEMQYVKAMNLNTIRLEGKLEDEHFFDLADQFGLLVMPGWCCCDLWEQWQAWEPKQVQTAGDSLHDQIMRLRSHPSVFVWLYGSDNPPTADVERMYLKILQDAQWPNPSISSAAAKPTTVTGPSGVKMSGPYDWVAPNYWLTDTKHGGAYGFNTETSPGPAVPPIQSLKKFIPADHLWPIDDVWNYHTGGGEFSDIHLFTDALNARYGKPNSAEDLARKSQWMTYEGERAMFEAYRRNKYTSTGVVQWMLNNAWPSLIWHLYDYYLLPGGGYFGTKKANEPLHIQYSYDDRSIAVVNDTQQSFGNLTASAEVYDTQMHKLFSNTQKLNAGPDSTQGVFNIPEQQQVSGTYFVKLRLADAHGKPVSDNFYWLSSKPDVSEFEKSEWYYTPVSQYADFTDLQKLPQAQIAVNSRALPASNGRNTTEITLRNTGQALAFGIELRLVKSEDQDDVLPAMWEDNYIALLPGESKTVHVSYTTQSGGASPHVIWTAANVAAGQ